MFVLPSSADVRRAYIEENLIPTQVYFYFPTGPEGSTGQACGLSAMAISQGAPRDQLKIQEYLGLVTTKVLQDGEVERIEINTVSFKDDPYLLKIIGFIHGFDGSNPEWFLKSPDGNDQLIDRESYMEGYRIGKETWDKVKDLRQKQEVRELEEVMA